MPELPEVEVTRLSFVDRIRQARVIAVQTGKPLRWPLLCEPHELVGRKVLGVRRRGKYLLIDLNEGLLMVHLGMSGSIQFAHNLPPAGKHDHFDLSTDKGTLRLNDPRRFGAVVYAPQESSPQAQKLLGKLGVEPLDSALNTEALIQAFRLRNAPIKQVLLSGALVVGVGNIYASEALFMSGIRPTTRASRISAARLRDLCQAIVTVLNRAVAKGGSTLQNFSNAQGESGYFQLEAQVYGRAGQACRACETPIRCIRQGQRATYYCPQCQK